MQTHAYFFSGRLGATGVNGVRCLQHQKPTLVYLHPGLCNSCPHCLLAREMKYIHIIAQTVCLTPSPPPHAVCQPLTRQRVHTIALPHTQTIHQYTGNETTSYHLSSHVLQGFSQRSRVQTPACTSFLVPSQPSQ